MVALKTHGRLGAAVLFGWTQRSALSLSASSRGAFKAHVDAVEAVPKAAEPVGTRAAHNARQAAVFDAAAPYFASAEATPRDVVEVLDAIADEVVASALHQSSGETHRVFRVLDVGTGTGCLARRYGAAAQRRGLACHVIGVDVSPVMVAAARAATTETPNVTYWVGDVLDYCASHNKTDDLFDAAVLNAVLGNLFDPPAVLVALSDRVRPGGVVVATHPLGAAFVEDLRAQDPTVVPHGLPRSIGAMRRLCCGAEDSSKTHDPFLHAEVLVERTPLGAAASADDDDDNNNRDAFRVPYWAAWRRRGSARLRTMVALSGTVARGYGRGSKQLGVPTANLPEGQFGDYLKSLDAGVYAGFARSQATVSRCVANVGYSPTFAGAENAVKIVEAHLLDYDGGDFYDAPLTLLLAAFQRPERKFNGLQALLDAIQGDIRTAAQTLNTPAYSHLCKHPALLDPQQPFAQVPWGDDDTCP